MSKFSKNCVFSVSYLPMLGPKVLQSKSPNVKNTKSCPTLIKSDRGWKLVFGRRSEINPNGRVLENCSETAWGVQSDPLPKSQCLT